MAIMCLLGASLNRYWGFYFNRARRRRAREATGVQEHKDGMSTDDEESNSDILRFNQEKGDKSTLNFKT